jgi:hypothetical protein
MEMVARYSGETKWYRMTDFFCERERKPTLLLAHAVRPLSPQSAQRDLAARAVAGSPQTSPMLLAMAAAAATARTSLAVNAELGVGEVAALDDLAQGEHREDGHQGEWQEVGEDWVHHRVEGHPIRGEQLKQEEIHGIFRLLLAFSWHFLVYIFPSRPPRWSPVGSGFGRRDAISTAIPPQKWAVGRGQWPGTGRSAWNAHGSGCP